MAAWDLRHVDAQLRAEPECSPVRSRLTASTLRHGDSGPGLRRSYQARLASSTDSPPVVRCNRSEPSSDHRWRRSRVGRMATAPIVRPDRHLEQVEWPARPPRLDGAGDPHHRVGGSRPRSPTSTMSYPATITGVTTCRSGRRSDPSTRRSAAVPSASDPNRPAASCSPAAWRRMAAAPARRTAFVLPAFLSALGPARLDAELGRMNHSGIRHPWFLAQRIAVPTYVAGTDHTGRRDLTQAS